MVRTFANQTDFEAFAAAFGRELRAGDSVGLSGPLGSGKTTFIRAVVKALHGDDPTTSPTFTFWHRYPGEPPVDHLDLYRVDDPRDLTELGLDEAFGGDSVVLVEWWRNAPVLLPSPHIEIDLDGSGDGPRTVSVTRP